MARNVATYTKRSPHQIDKVDKEQTQMVLGKLAGIHILCSYHKAVNGVSL